MPHFPKPFFRASRGLWYVQINDKQLNLGADRTAAFSRYHELMANAREPEATHGSPRQPARRSDRRRVFGLV